MLKSGRRYITVIAVLFYGPVFAQSTETTLEYASAGNTCATLESQFCRTEVLDVLDNITADFFDLARDSELEKLVDALVNALTIETDIRFFQSTAAMLRIIASLFSDPEKFQTVLAIADVIAQGQSVTLSPNSLLASAN